MNPSSGRQRARGEEKKNEGDVKCQRTFIPLFAGRTLQEGP